MAREAGKRGGGGVRELLNRSGGLLRGKRGGGGVRELLSRSGGLLSGGRGMISVVHSMTTSNNNDHL